MISYLDAKVSAEFLLQCSNSGHCNCSDSSRKVAVMLCSKSAHGFGPPVHSPDNCSGSVGTEGSPDPHRLSGSVRRKLNPVVTSGLSLTNSFNPLVNVLRPLAKSP